MSSAVEWCHEYRRAGQRLQLRRARHGVGYALPVRQGVVTKNGECKGVTLSLAGKPQSAPQPEALAIPDTPEPEVVSTKTSIDVLADIPVFTARKTDLIIPTVDYISREIRRTESKLASLKKLRTAANNIRRHKSLLQELAQ